PPPAYTRLSYPTAHPTPSATLLPYTTLFRSVGSWTLDGLDYFILVFVLTDVANGLKSTVTTASLAITLTLLLRPIGAIIFGALADRKSTRLNSSHVSISYAVFCLNRKNTIVV